MVYLSIFLELRSRYGFRRETLQAIEVKFKSKNDEAIEMVQAFLKENVEIQSYQSHMAAIALCEDENIEELKHYLACAIVDPRDVLYWYYLSQKEKNSD